jgi:hypothetical protein
MFVLVIAFWGYRSCGESAKINFFFVFNDPDDNRSEARQTSGFYVHAGDKILITFIDR